MSDSDEFSELIAAIRAGEEAAAARLLAKFDSYMERVVRFQMRHRGDYNRLRPQVGASDICQSVFKSLFDGLRKGRFELSRPEQLEKLLSAMSRLKIATEGRKLNVILREVLDLDAAHEQMDPGRDPGKCLDDQDLAEAVVKQFSADELDLLMRRLDDQPWSAIATALGGQADALRKKLARAIERVRETPVCASALT
jgi:DNA-directed RNA polymerase specialized sigma24 family protein